MNAIQSYSYFSQLDIDEIHIIHWITSSTRDIPKLDTSVDWPDSPTEVAGVTQGETDAEEAALPGRLLAETILLHIFLDLIFLLLLFAHHPNDFFLQTIWSIIRPPEIQDLTNASKTLRRGVNTVSNKAMTGDYSNNI